MKYNGTRPTVSPRFLLEIAITGILLLAIAVPRLLDLAHFVTTDETIWLGAGGKFYYALAHHDLTFARSHPAVTTIWAGLASFVLEDPKYAKGQGGAEHATSLFTLQRRQSDLPLRLLVTGRRILISFNLLVLVISFLFAQQLLGTLPALAGFLLIAFDPFHIALSKVLQPDGTLANLLLLSLIAFLVYLEKRYKTALVVSAIAAGLAWLTKSPGMFLIPFMVLLTVLYRLHGNNKYDKNNWRKFVLADAQVLAVWGVIAALVFCLFWPAMWVNPIGTLTNVLGAAIGYAEEGHESAVFFNGKIYPNGNIPDISFYLISFLWRTTPVTLLGLFAAPVLLLQKNRISHSEAELSSHANNPLPNRLSTEQNSLSTMASQKWAVGMLLLFGLAFASFMTVGLKKFDRYAIPSFIALDLAAGASLIYLTGWIGQLLHEKWRTAVTWILFLGFVTIQAALAWRASPYYFNYYNPLLGGSRSAVATMQIGWGEGLDQAARYINQKPNSNRLSVMAWYGRRSFYFFSNSRVYDVSSQWSASDWDQFNKSDYIVIYLEEWQRNLPAEVLDRLRNLQPEYSVWIDGLEYVRVYKIQ
jgi:4-amino-4-deoxy-L-arabinose transferase-like glycosyltransferase